MKFTIGYNRYFIEGIILKIMRKLVFISLIAITFSANAGNNLPYYRNTPELIELCLIYKDQPVFPQLCDVLFDSLKAKGKYYLVYSVIEIPVIDHIENPPRIRLYENDWVACSDNWYPYFRIQITDNDSLLIQNEFLFKFDKASIKKIQVEYYSYYVKSNDLEYIAKEKGRQNNFFKVKLKITDRENIPPKMWTMYFNTINLIYLMAKFEINNVANDLYEKPFIELNNEEKLNAIEKSGYFIELMFN